MTCPRCTTPLVLKTIKELHRTIEVDVCNNCGGTWLDEGEISPLESVTEFVIWERRRVPQANAQMERLACPKCTDNRWLQKVEHPRDAKVIMDFCDNCNGIWLDKGEIEAIQQENFIKAIFRLLKG